MHSNKLIGFIFGAMLIAIGCHTATVSNANTNANVNAKGRVFVEVVKVVRV